MARTSQSKQDNSISPLNDKSAQTFDDQEQDELLANLIFGGMNNEDMVSELRERKRYGHYQQHDDFENNISSYVWKKERVAK